MIPANVHKSISRDFFSDYPEEWREREINKCVAPIRLNEVLTLIKSRGDLFYALVVDEGNKEHFYKFAYDTVDFYEVDELGDLSTSYLGNKIKQSEIEELNIIKFDLETVRRVLIEVRECPCGLAKRLLLDDLYGLNKDISKINYTVIKYSGVNMGINIKNLGGIRAGIYNKIKEKLKNSCEGRESSTP